MFYGIDWNGPVSYDDDEDVNVSQTFCPLQDIQMEELKQVVVPLAHSANYGLDLYLATLSFIQNILDNH